MEDLQIVEYVVREDPQVIEQCGIIGIPKEDMHKVYCDRKRSRYITMVKLLTQFKPGRLDTTSALVTKCVCNKR